MCLSWQGSREGLAAQAGKNQPKYLGESLLEGPTHIPGVFTMNLRPVASMDDTAPKLIHSPQARPKKGVQILPQDFRFSEK